MSREYVRGMKSCTVQIPTSLTESVIPHKIKLSEGVWRACRAFSRVRCLRKSDPLVLSAFFTFFKKPLTACRTPG